MSISISFGGDKSTTTVATQQVFIHSLTLLTLCLVGLSAAQPNNPICCTSKQWNGEVHSNFFEQAQNSSGLQVLSSVFREHIEYDAANQRLRIDTIE